MRIGTRNKWKFVQDPCDGGSPLLTKFQNGQRIHFNPGKVSIEAEIKKLEHGAILTDAQVAAILGR